MSSKLYKCKVMHNRLTPKKHRFTYNIFMFWLDIDKLKETSNKLRFFSCNRSNIFNFRDDDHFKFPKGDTRNSLDVRTNINNYLKECGITEEPFKVFLLTHVRMFGHVFNPVSFYFCYDVNGVCKFVVTEISNTYGEMKMFLIDKKYDKGFEQNAIKYFYVSPFTELDEEFEFRYQMPGEKMNIQINVKNKEGFKFFISTLTGIEKKLTDSRLLAYVFRFPFITIRVLWSIHFQALLLWLKKVPFHKKNANKDLQKGITNNIHAE